MKKNDELESFVRAKAATAAEAEPGIDWEARRDKWLDEIGKLYGLVRKWLEPLERDDTVRYSTSPITIDEDYIGSYQAERLILLIAKQRVELRPKGTLIVGAEGRVDVRGQRAARSIILKGNQWFVLERVPELKTVPFNKKAFKNILQEVMA